VSVLLFAIAIGIGEAVVVERPSPGLVPSMHFAYVNSYRDDLSWRGTLLSFPHAQTPGAVRISLAGEIYLTHVACDTSCVSQIVRYDANGLPVTVGPPFTNLVASIAFTLTGDLMVTFREGYLLRMDANGRLIERIDLPVTDIYDFDIDRDGCTALFATLQGLSTVDLCSARQEVKQRLVAPAGAVTGVRFLPDGSMLAASRGAVYQLNRNGMLIRKFMTYPGFFGYVVLDPDGDSFWTNADFKLIRFSLLTGKAIAGPVQIRSGIHVRSMAVRGEWRASLHPLPRRRAVTR
jgi:hypothetical protein